MIGRVRRLSYCVAGSWCVVNCCQQQLGQFDRKSVSENVPDPTACDRSAPGRAISQEFGTLAFPDEGNGGFALADDNEEGSSNESQWGHREGEPSGSPPSAGLHREASYSATVRACVVQNCAKVTPLLPLHPPPPPLCPAPG